MTTKSAAPAATDTPAPVAETPATPAPAPAPAADAPVEDPFAAAFALLANNADDKAAADVAEAAKKKPPEEAPAAPATEAPETSETPAEPPAEEPAPAEERPAPAAESAEATGDVLERLAKLVKGAPAEPEPKPAPQPAPAVEAEIFSPEEKQLLTTYEKDWPDVARAETLRRRAEYRDLVGFVFNEVAKEIKPIIDVVRTLSERTHLSDLTQAAPDYEQTRDAVIEWVKTQPVYLQTAYKHVISQGTAEEVGDLIGRYKQATGQPAASQKTPAAPVPARPETELPPAAKKAAAALAPVSSKRSAVVQQTHPSDFEGAFAAFAKEQNS